MFRRPKPQQPPLAPTTEPRAPGGAPAADAQDATQVLAELLARPTQEGVLEGALRHAATLLGGQGHGFAVVRRGQDQVAAVLGYPRALIGTALSGPWTEMRPRVLSDGSRELLSLNPPEVQEVLRTCGMEDAKVSVVLPVSDRGRNLGALVIDRHDAAPVSPAAQEAAARWVGAVAPLLGILEGRESWRLAARQLSGALVEAVESQEFDALGHSQAVADLSLKLGRQIGLSERELEEVWFAAMLHDIGKIHGEVGHAQVGANFLHGVSHLSEAQKAIRHHHERWDGQGEPDGLHGEDIPLYARILTAANAVVRAGSVEKAVSLAGTVLDPRMVAHLQKLPQ